MHAKKIDFCIGVLFVFGLALLSQWIIMLPFLAHAGISSLIIAIILGMLIGNAWTVPTNWLHGIQFAAKRILRLAIILYGFRISIQELMAAGSSAFVIACIMVITILLLGFLIGRKLIKLDTELSLLISIGAAVCGAAAVLALEDILKSQAHKTSVAIATVVIFGTLSMFIYPVLQQNGWLHFTPEQFGIFAGASIHEVAQVVVAGANINETTAQLAVIVKMMRVILLVPLLLILSWLNNRYNLANKQHKLKIVIPWFALGFLLMIGIHSWFINDTQLVQRINQFDTFLLTMAMGAIGLETKWVKIKHVGMKPFYLASLLFLCLFAIAKVCVMWIL